MGVAVVTFLLGPLVGVKMAGLAALVATGGARFWSSSHSYGCASGSFPALALQGLLLTLIFNNFSGFLFSGLQITGFLFSGFLGFRFLNLVLIFSGLILEWIVSTMTFIIRSKLDST